MGVVLLLLLLLLLLKAHNGLSYTNEQILIFDELVQGAADGSSMGAL